MPKKREGGSPAPGESPSGFSPDEEQNSNTSNPSAEEGKKIGITGLPVEEQRSNFIKIAIFLIGAAALVFGLKTYLGW